MISGPPDLALGERAGQQQVDGSHYARLLGPGSLLERRRVFSRISLIESVLNLIVANPLWALALSADQVPRKALCVMTQRQDSKPRGVP